MFSVEGSHRLAVSLLSRPAKMKSLVLVFLVQIPESVTLQSLLPSLLLCVFIPTLIWRAGVFLSLRLHAPGEDEHKGLWYVISSAGLTAASLSSLLCRVVQAFDKFHLYFAPCTFDKFFKNQKDINTVLLCFSSLATYGATVYVQKNR